VPDLIFTLTTSGGGSGDVTASVSRYPTGNVLPGEVVMFYVTGTSGFTGSDEYEELDFEWDFGDSGSTFTVAQGIPNSDANTEVGRVVSHAYTTTGAKTVTLTMRDLTTGQVGSATLSITVDDPDADITWDHDLYIDFGEVSGTPDFTDAPAEAGAVQHISSLSELLAFTPTALDKTRITFKRGETFTVNDTIKAQGQCYITSNTAFGSGDRAKIIASGTTTTELELFNPGDAPDVSRFSVYEVDFDGGYDPVIGRNSAPWTWVCRTGLTSGGSVLRSFFRCRATGMRQFYGSSAGGPTVDGFVYVCLSDCDIRDWSDYGMAGFGVRNRVSVTGTSIQQNPLAIMRDAKKDAADEAADHGCLRMTATEYIGVTNCNLASSNGWSALGQDYAIQPCLRILVVFNETAGFNIYEQSVVNVQRNKGHGNAFMIIGYNNPIDSGYIPRVKANIERNNFNRTRQKSGVFVGSNGATGLYIRNNVYYDANVFQPGGGAELTMCSYNDPIDSQWTFATGADSGKLLVSFNTVVSDVTSADITLAENPSVTFTRGTGLPVSFTEENNIIQAPNWANGGSFTDYGTLDRANDFKPVTGSSAIDAVSSGSIPVRDFDGNLRTATTNVGAHHDQSPSAGAVDAPSSSAAPTIAELAAFPSEWHVTDFGTWTNWSGDDQYMAQWEWSVDGTPAEVSGWYNPIQAAGLNTYWPYAQGLGPASGQLTCKIMATNRSGTLVSSAASNDFTLT